MRRLAVVLAGMTFSLVVASHSTQAALILELDTNFSNNTTPNGSAPWLRATFEQQSADIVRLTMDSLLQDPAEFVDGNQGWYFNLDPVLDPTQLVFTFVSATNFNGAGSVNINTGTNFTNGDGGGLYDMQFDFPGAPPGNRFSVGAQLVYDIALSGLVKQSFNFFSDASQNGGNGTFVSAAHVQGIRTGAGSSHIGTTGTTGGQVVPEPGTLVLVGSGLLGIGSAARRKSRKKEMEE